MLINPSDLGDWMFGVNRTAKFDETRAAQSIRIAEGWLLSATRMDPWPDLTQGADTIPDDLAAWDLELSALCYVNNPKTATQRQVGAIITQWAPDAQAKRQQILGAAKARYNQTGLPRGSFPPAKCWPDEARSWGVGEVWFR